MNYYPKQSESPGPPRLAQMVNPQNEVRRSVLAVETSELEKVISDLTDAINQLSVKLEPVMRPLEPMSESPLVKDPEPCLPPLGENIRSHRQRVYQLALRVRGLIEAVEL